MRLKLRLIQDEKVLFEIPLSPADWSRQRLGDELEAFDADCQRFSRIFDALSHATRLRMMRRIMEEEDRTVNFADFMRDLNLNPKIVWENAKKLSEGGLLEKVGRGRYRCSEVGQRGFILLSLALKRLISAVEEMDNVWEVEASDV